MYLVMIFRVSFSSSFPFKYQKTLPSDISQPKYVFECIFRQHDDGKENNINDYNYQQLDSLKLQPDFKYYQNHEFHKLCQNFKKKKKNLHYSTYKHLPFQR